jgi:hypothetical protein
MDAKAHDSQAGHPQNKSPGTAANGEQQPLREFGEKPGRLGRSQAQDGLAPTLTVPGPTEVVAALGIPGVASSAAGWHARCARTRGVSARLTRMALVMGSLSLLHLRTLHEVI